MEAFEPETEMRFTIYIINNTNILSLMRDANNGDVEARTVAAAIKTATENPALPEVKCLVEDCNNRVCEKDRVPHCYVISTPTDEFRHMPKIVMFTCLEHADLPMDVILTEFHKTFGGMIVPLHDDHPTIQ